MTAASRLPRSGTPAVGQQVAPEPAMPRRRRAPAVRLVRLLVLLGVLLLLGALVAASAAALPARRPAAAAMVVAEPLTVRVGPEPDGTPVTLDASVFSPGGQRRPAVLLAHGFGGSKDDLTDRAQALAGRGYVVLTYTARGFGDSGGRIHLNDPDHEVADARILLDTLAGRGDVLLDGPGDPRVGVAGASYGGALALMLAGVDPRVDAIVPAVTWHDLADAFFPDFRAPASPGTPAALAPTSGTDPRRAGPFKRRWASVLFSGVASPGPGAATGDAGPSTGPSASAADAVCARVDPSVCRLFLQAGETGRPSASLLAILRRHSPAPTLAQVRAPTLLVQGMRDSLFGLEHADATARALTASGAPVAVRWVEAGHDGGVSPPDEELLTPWLDRHLALAGSGIDERFPGFLAPVPPVTRNADPGSVSAAAYPGTGAAAAPEQVVVPLRPLVAGSAARRLLSPPGGDPAAMTSLPAGAGEADGELGAAAYRLAALPGQSVAFETGPLAASATLVGSPRVRLRVSSTTSDVTLFCSLWRVGSTGPTSLRRLVAPVRVPITAGRAAEVDVALPAGTAAMPQGSRWRVLVSATDAGFASPPDARGYVVDLAGDRGLHLPTMTPQAGGPAGFDTETAGVATALVAVLLALALAGASAAWRRRRADAVATREDERDVPLVVEGLTKTYRDGHRAVDDVTWSARRGEVVGLLGPNGAGKTTTMRMLVGLIRPDAGHVRVLGEPIHAGSPVLARVGALIEGPGFLPHLTGRQNLHAYWAATGRDPREAGLEDVLAVAALGDALDRPVRTYSHGMRQRLGIAQAMLGRPPVLLLDEPTNGLDPPQIAAMRPILRAYAASGRTVVVSSHLLAEVEETCTHVVVMNRGRVVVAGAVPDLLASDDVTIVTLEQGRADEARHVARRLRRGRIRRRIEEIRVDAARRRLTIVADAPRAEVVAAIVRAGGRVVEVAAHRRLEEVFLGVISDAGGAGAGTAAPARRGEAVADDDETARIDRLRQVRAR